MTNYLQTPETREQISARAERMLADGAAFAKLADALADFEAATGRPVLISESRTQADSPAAKAARDRFLAFADRRVAELEQQEKARAARNEAVVPVELGVIKFPNMPEAEPAAEPNGIELENAAQAEPIDTGSAETVTEPQDVRRASLQDIRAMKDAGQLREPVGEHGPDLPADFWDKAKARYLGAADEVRAIMAPLPEQDAPAPERKNDYTRPMAAQDAPVTAHAAETPSAAPEAPKEADTPPAASTAARRPIPDTERRSMGQAHHGRAPDRRPCRKPARMDGRRG